jgi:anti-anti-sigma factor
VSPYELNTRDAEGVVVVTVAGELDLTNAPELEARIAAAAPEDAPLVLDLDRVEFLDSAVMHVLFRLARERGTEAFAIVVSPDAPTMRALTLVGLDRVTRLEPSLEALGLAPTE